MLGRKPQYKKQSLKKLSQKYPLTLPTTLRQNNICKNYLTARQRRNST